MVNFSVKGAGKYRAAANGDATSLDLFHLPKMPAFSGQLTAIVQSGEQAGEIVFEARAKGLKSGKLVLYTSEKLIALFASTLPHLLCNPLFIGV